MRKIVMILSFCAICMFLYSCSRGITTYEAANGKARCGKYIR
ncbi:MAG: hypothetical protein U0T56_05000 [Ferruginibacter sp.]